MSRRHPVPPRAAAQPGVNPNAAGLDIGSEEIWACVPEDRDPQPVRVFGTFPLDLYALADWLAACRLETVAMASTGVYWMPVYEVLEERGFRVHLVNARRLQQVPGRKSDLKDCQWLPYLHTCGLLRGSFRPEAQLCALRAYLRHRATRLEHRAAPIQHRHKALQQMHIQLTQVLSDLTGATGLARLRAIVAGERDPVQLAQFRDPRGARSPAAIIKALTGHDQPEPVFALKPALALYALYTTPLRECEAAIEPQFHALKPVWEDELPPRDPTDTPDSQSKNAPRDDARRLLYEVTGVDLVAIPGLNTSTVRTIVAAVGTDMTTWPSAKPCCSWLTLAPHHDISGGTGLRRSTLKTGNRAGQALRLAAQSLSRSHSALGAYDRRMRARLGPKAAIVATAHKRACIVYHMLKHRTPYRDLSAEAYEQRARDREIATLRKKAAKLGLTLVASPA